MSEIQAIETVYNGYRFRSRLEARWAVFFDNMGYKWEYEPEGFVLTNGEYYLPDFYLQTPFFDGYCEVKPFNVNKFDSLINDLTYRLTMTTQKRSIFLNGVPDYKTYFAKTYTDDIWSWDGNDFDPYEKDEKGNDEWCWPESYYYDKGVWKKRDGIIKYVFLDNKIMYNEDETINEIDDESHAHYFNIGANWDYWEAFDDDLFTTIKDDTLKPWHYRKKSYSKDYQNAVTAARSARFEYGEKNGR